MLYDGRVVHRGAPDDFRRADVPLVQWFLRGKAGTDGAEWDPPLDAGAPSVFSGDGH